MSTQDTITSVSEDIIRAARESGEQTVVFVTGNSYYPALRSYPEMEAIWQRSAGEFMEAAEAVVRAVEDANVYLGVPDYDNALYAVDLERFELIDPDDPQNGNTDFLDCEWRKVQ